MKHLLLYLCSVIFLFSATAETVPFDIVPQPQSVAIDGASFEITGITISDPGRFLGKQGGKTVSCKIPA